MYFSEKGNVDDDATLITIFLVSFNLQSAICSLQSVVCSLRSAVCSLQMSYTATVAVCSLGFSLLIGFHSNISNI